VVLHGSNGATEAMAERMKAMEGDGEGQSDQLAKFASSLLAADQIAAMVV
jgi:hypothetical protein